MTNVDPNLLNLMSGNAFEFSISNFKEVEFLVDKVTLPGLDVPPVKVPNPFAPVYVSGDSPSFTDLSVRFKVNESISNWLTLFNWISNTATASNYTTHNSENLYSNIILTVLSNKRNPLVEFTFVGAFPYSLSSLDLAITDGTINYKDAVVTFKFQRMEPRSVG